MNKCVKEILIFNYCYYNMKVIITTSGIGSRLGDLTKYTNKSLMKVGDKFAIDYIFDLYKKYF